jgi:F0F1-type ATP synthase membrane subunit b/b'
LQAARAAASETAAAIEAQARREARELAAAGQREVAAAAESARNALRAETAALAAHMAARLLREELTPERNRELVARLTEKL